MKNLKKLIQNNLNNLLIISLQGEYFPFQGLKIISKTNIVIHTIWINGLKDSIELVKIIRVAFVKL